MRTNHAETVGAHLGIIDKMTTNNKISSHIKQWHIEYDQNGFLSNEDWLLTADKTEDILQLSHVYQEGLILDVGFYQTSYKIYVIFKNDWDNPKEVFESNDTELVTNKLIKFICY